MNKIEIIILMIWAVLLPLIIFTEPSTLIEYCLWVTGLLLFLEKHLKNLGDKSDD